MKLKGKKNVNENFLHSEFITSSLRIISVTVKKTFNYDVKSFIMLSLDTVAIIENFFAYIAMKTTQKQQL